MTMPRLDLRRAPRGPVLLTLFGVQVQAGRLTAEAAYVPLAIKRPVNMQADQLKVRVHPVAWTGFSVEKSHLDQVNIEVRDGE